MEKSLASQAPLLCYLLFIVYINDTDYSICDNLLKFADDAKFYSVASDMNEINKPQLDLHRGRGQDAHI